MTSEQVMLTIVALGALALGGCALPAPKGADPLEGPYARRQVWAVAPLGNESGSAAVRGDRLADHLARQLENASNLDVLAVNRTLAAMEGLGFEQVTTPAEALQLLRVLGADGLVVGTVTAYDPFDPPKLGLALELYAAPGGALSGAAPDLRHLRSAAVERGTAPAGSAPTARQPVSVVSAFFDAADPHVRRQLQRYAYDRGANSPRDGRWLPQPFEKDDGAWRTYRLSMDLFSEFASYVMSWRLLRAEAQRLAPAPAAADQALADAQPGPAAPRQSPAP